MPVPISVFRLPIVDTAEKRYTLNFYVENKLSYRNTFSFEGLPISKIVAVQIILVKVPKPFKLNRRYRGITCYVPAQSCTDKIIFTHVLVKASKLSKCTFTTCMLHYIQVSIQMKFPHNFPKLLPLS